MIRQWLYDPPRWRAALWLGLVSSTFSTVVSSLIGARLGRDVAVDWMSVAAIPVRDAAFDLHPAAWAIAVGVLFHQWADFSWDLVFFGLLGRWTARLGPGPLLVVGVPWAVLTSTLEWLVLAPLFPFRQPIFPLEPVYWLGLFVHLSSVATWPLFPWLLDRARGRRDPRHRRIALQWSGAAALLSVVLVAGSVAGLAGHEPAWLGRDARFDQAFMRRMAAHHAQGVQLAALAAQRAQDPHLRALARLMGASQAGEIDIFRQWWRGWFDGPLPEPTHDEMQAMPGMLGASQMAQLSAAAPAAFDRAFVEAMSFHHRGAIAMCNDAMAHASDPRLRAMAHAIRHAQTGEIALMHGIRPGMDVLRTALGSLLAPPGASP